MGAFVAAALAAPLAEAAEVRLERLQFDCTRTMCPPNYGERLVVRGDRGEANRLSVAQGAAGEFLVSDVGAALRAGPGCAPAGKQLVACPTSTPRLVAFVFGGDRGDTVTPWWRSTSTAAAVNARRYSFGRESSRCDMGASDAGRAQSHGSSGRRL